MSRLIQHTLHLESSCGVINVGSHKGDRVIITISGVSRCLYIEGDIRAREVIITMPDLKMCDKLISPTSITCETLVIRADKLRHIGDWFYNAERFDCHRVTIEAASLESIGASFFSPNSITEFNLTSPALVSIGDNFLRNSSAMCKYRHSQPELVRMGDFCFANMPSLVDIMWFTPNLERIGESCLSNCFELPDLKLTLESALVIGPNFLSNTKCDITLCCPNLYNLGPGFAEITIRTVENRNLHLHCPRLVIFQKPGSPNTMIFDDSTDPFGLRFYSSVSWFYSNLTTPQTSNILKFIDNLKYACLTEFSDLDCLSPKKFTGPITLQDWLKMSRIEMMSCYNNVVEMRPSWVQALFNVEISDDKLSAVFSGAVQGVKYFVEQIDLRTILSIKRDRALNHAINWINKILEIVDLMEPSTVLINFKRDMSEYYKYLSSKVDSQIASPNRRTFIDALYNCGYIDDHEKFFLERAPDSNSVDVYSDILIFGKITEAARERSLNLNELCVLNSTTAPCDMLSDHFEIPNPVPIEINMAANGIFSKRELKRILCGKLPMKQRLTSYADLLEFNIINASDGYLSESEIAELCEYVHLYNKKIITEFELHKMTESFEKKLDIVTKVATSDVESTVERPSPAVKKSDYLGNGDVKIAYKVHKLEDVVQTSILNSIENCPICRESLQDACLNCNQTDSIQFNECNLVRGICSHMYHAHCIQQWLTRQTSCPMCSREWESPEVINRTGGD